MTSQGTRIGRIGPPLSEEEQARRAQARADEDYLDAHYEELVKQYPRHWVAVREGAVVLVGTDIFEFGRALRERGLTKAGVRVRYLEPDNVPLIL